MVVKTEMDASNLLTKIRSSIKHMSILFDDRPLLVAVSGGPDSICMLHLLCQLKEIMGFNLHVVHLNHALRGIESDNDAHYVNNLCLELDIPATIEKRDVEASITGSSIEEKARYMRYKFFSEVARDIGASYVAVGHTSDDQIETILMHFIRGSGISGLCGMKPVQILRIESEDSYLTVIRPLLEIARKDTEAYCNGCGLSPREDLSNKTLRYMRNRFRYELIPLLRQYNPNVGAAILRTAALLDDEREFISAYTQSILEMVVTKKNESLIINRETFSHLPLAVKRSLLRTAVKELLGDLTDIEADHIEIMMDGMQKSAGKKLILPRGLLFYMDYESCFLRLQGKEDSIEDTLSGEVPLNIPGKTYVAGWSITAEIYDDVKQNTSHRYKEYFDYDVAGNKLTVRPRKPGDKFHPLGMSKPKSVQDFMVNIKIPRNRRATVPIVCSPRQLVWVVGWRIDDRVRLTSSTRRILSIEFERVSY